MIPGAGRPAWNFLGSDLAMRLARGAMLVVMVLAGALVVLDLLARVF